MPEPPKRLKASDILINYKGDPYDDREPEVGIVLALAAGTDPRELRGYLRLGPRHAELIYPKFGMQAEYEKPRDCPMCNFKHREMNDLLHHLQARHQWSLKLIGMHLRKLGK